MASSVPHALRLLLAGAAGLVAVLPVLGGPRLHHIQIIGTHNSYHVAPHPSLDALIRSQSPEEADSVQYTHRPLREQLEHLAIRQIELDVFADPHGGLFAQPAGIRIAAVQGLLPVPPPDASLLREPGTKILHVPDFDFQTTAPTLRLALRELVAWSDAHPAHVPVFVLIELKDEAVGPEYTQPIPWNADRILSLERDITDQIPHARILRPDDIRGSRRTLRDAVLADGWPDLAEVRGRFVFLLDNTDHHRDLYLAGASSLEGRLFFVSVEEDHPAAAWFKINDPIHDFDRIQRLVRQGFLVRTRADAGTRQARLVDVSQRDAALASGAHLVSTDYPEPQPSWGPYRVGFAQGIVARPNPVSAPSLPADINLEELALPGLEPFAAAELESLNRRAMAAHALRRLAEASRDYRRLLELEPAQGLSPETYERILHVAPRLYRVPGDPFPLRDVVAVHHPQRPLIGFHLFWDDDIDFPEDNDPADHEVVWVEYDALTGRPTRLFAYFHGRVLESPCPEERPAFAVEWGKHGSIPLLNGQPTTEPESLHRHWQTLHSRGTRMPNHPLARDWPRRFEGDWNDYRRFTEAIDLEPIIERRRLAWRSRWANAVLDQHALFYNFAAKIEWPD